MSTPLESMYDSASNDYGFGCGMYFSPAFHTANPDLVITLQPILYNPQDPSVTYPLGNPLSFPALEPSVTIIPPTQAEPNAVVADIDNGYFTTDATEAATIDYSSLLPGLSVEFTAAAVQQIATTAGDSSIKLKIEDVTESGVTDSKTIQITLVDENDDPVYAEGTAAGTATVTIPFTVPAGKVPVVNLVVGETKTRVAGATYDSENGTVSFTVEHFSEYEITITSLVAQIGNVKYESLAEAVAAVPADGTATTITMIANEAIDVVGSAITIAAGKNVVLDLNGKTVTGACTESGTSALIRNLGTLTVEDSSEDQTGKLIGGADPTWTWDGSDNYSGSYASNLIRNEGTLVVNGGTLYNASTGSAAYAIDNYGAGTVTINGGTVDAKKAAAIRMFYNNGGSLTMTDGTVGHYTSDDNCSYMGIQVMSGTDADVAISGGTIAGMYALYSSGTGGSSVSISGGTFDGYVGFASAGPADIAITDGTFLEWVGTWGSQTEFISGGLFAEDLEEGDCADGYIPVLTEVNGEAFYQVVHGWKVTFANYDGTTLFETNVVLNAKPGYEGDTPTRAADADGVYTFAGWTNATLAVATATADLPAVTDAAGAVTYAAAFTAESSAAMVITIADNGDGTSTTNVVGFYATVAEAVQQAPAGATIVLNDDIALADTVTIDKDLVIDLNGNDIAATNVRAIWIKVGNVEFTGEGTISATGSGLETTSSVICVGDGDSNANTAGLTIGEGVTVSSDKCCGVLMCGENAGTLTISGGSVTGPTAVYVTSGTVNVTGGTLTGTGDALVIDSCDYPDSVPSASITGGTFLSTSGKPVATYATNRQARVTGFIPGTVNGEPNPARFSSANADGVVAGYVLVEGSDGLYSVVKTWVVSWVVGETTVQSNAVPHGTTKAEVEALAPPCPVAPSHASGTVSRFLGWVPDISGPVESDVTYTAEFSEVYYALISEITFTSISVQGTKVTAGFRGTFSEGEGYSRYQALVKTELNGEKVPVDARISLDIVKQIGSVEVDLSGDEYATKAFLVGLSGSDPLEGD